MPIYSMYLHPQIYNTQKRRTISSSISKAEHTNRLTTLTMGSEFNISEVEKN